MEIKDALNFIPSYIRFKAFVCIFKASIHIFEKYAPVLKTNIGVSFIKPSLAKIFQPIIKLIIKIFIEATGVAMNITDNSSGPT